VGSDRGVAVTDEEIGISDELVAKAIAAGREYCLSFYRAGPSRNQPPAELEQLQAAHLRYLFRLKVEGGLLINGPVTDDEQLRGESIWASSDKEEVSDLLDGDPAVRAGRLVYEIHIWFGMPGDGLPR